MKTKIKIRRKQNRTNKIKKNRRKEEKKDKNTPHQQTSKNLSTNCTSSRLSIDKRTNTVTTRPVLVKKVRQG
jgi:hypothetical protein